MPHVDEGLLHTYLDGELEGAERDRVLAHLGECAECRTRLEEARALVARAGELLARAAPPKREMPAFPGRRSYAPRWRVPAAWAATVTIAFAVGWYAQGERLRRELAAVATLPEAGAPAPIATPPAVSTATAAKAKSAPAPQSSGERTRNSAPRQDAAPERAAMPAAAPAEVRALRDEPAEWPALDAAGARTLLGRAPAVLPGYAVRRVALSPAGDGVVLIEQELRPGTVLRLYERRAIETELDATRPRSEGARAAAAPSALALRRENMARYVNSLRVEIAGPLAADSLARLLDSVE